MSLRKRLTTWSKRSIVEMFGVDLRSLAIMRILLGLILIRDLFVRFQYLEIFYTDYGALPRYVVLDFWERPMYVSLHMMSGAWLWQAALFLVAGFCSFCFMIGCRTRLMGWLSWFFLISLHIRNPLVLNGGDIVFRMVLFWSLFLPLGARYSLDVAPIRRAIGEWKKPVNSAFASIASFGLILQMAFIYIFSAIMKDGRTWHEDSSAIYYALNVDYITWRAPADFLLQYPELCAWLTDTTLLLEFWGPFFLLTPFFRAPVRFLVCSLFIGLHIGFVFTMTLGLFPFVCIAAWIGLMPGAFWDRLGLRELSANRTAPRQRVGWTNQIIALFAIYLVTAWNFGTLDRQRGNELCPHGFSMVDGFCMGRDTEELADRIDLLGTDCPEGYTADSDECVRTEECAAHAIEPHGTRCPSTYTMSGNYCVSNSHRLRQARHPRTPNWFERQYGYPVTGWLRPLARSVRLDQSWNMFAPNPLKDDGWFVIPGELGDRSEVELFGGGAVDWDKPDQVSDIFVDQRWRKFMRNLYARRYSDLRLYYGRYLCRDFNEGLEGDERLESFEMFFVRERTSPPPSETEERFTIPLADLETEGYGPEDLPFEACADLCVERTDIHSSVTRCEVYEDECDDGARVFANILPEFVCEGVTGGEVPEPERVSLWTHRCFERTHVPRLGIGLVTRYEDTNGHPCEGTPRELRNRSDCSAIRGVRTTSVDNAPAIGSLREGDLIRTIDGQPMRSADEVQDAIMAAEDRVTLSITRRNTEIEFELLLD